MCDKCREIDSEIERCREIISRVNDLDLAIEMRKLIAELIAERAERHPEPRG